MTTQGDCLDPCCDYRHPVIEGQPDPSYLPFHIKRDHPELYQKLQPDAGESEASV